MNSSGARSNAKNVRTCCVPDDRRANSSARTKNDGGLCKQRRQLRTLQIGLSKKSYLAERFFFREKNARCRGVVGCCPTARQGPDDESLKVGEFDRGQIIACVEELTEEGSGIVRVRSSTAPKGAPRGGWLKKATSKGKPLLEKVEYANSARAVSTQAIRLLMTPGSFLTGCFCDCSCASSR